MADNFRALSSDFYVNQRLNLKMDLPKEREPILDMFDRVRRQFPAMQQFRRYRNELALETGPAEDNPLWIAIQTNSIRSGCVNPASFQDAYALHRHVLETAPYFLSISPLDVDYLELLFGFDLVAAGNHDQIVFDALMQQTPLARALDFGESTPIDCQPVVGVRLSDDIEAYVEVKTRSNERRGRGGDAPGEPISIYLTLRRLGPILEIKSLLDDFNRLARHGEELAESRVVPNLVVPIREAIGSGS